MPHRTFFPNVRVRGGGAYGNAVLSRFPIAAARNIDLTYPGRKHRSALYAVLNVPGAHGGRPRAVHVFNLHLGLAGFERTWQLSRFFADHPFAGLAQRTPVIVGGDFNDVWGRLGRTVFRARGFPRAAAPRPHLPGLGAGARPRRGLRARQPARAAPVPLAPARGAVRVRPPPPLHRTRVHLARVQGGPGRRADEPQAGRQLVPVRLRQLELLRRHRRRRVPGLLHQRDRRQRRRPRRSVVGPRDLGEHAASSRSPRRSSGASRITPACASGSSASTPPRASPPSRASRCWSRERTSPVSSSSWPRTSAWRGGWFSTTPSCRRSRRRSSRGGFRVGLRGRVHRLDPLAADRAAAGQGRPLRRDLGHGRRVLRGLLAAGVPGPAGRRALGHRGGGGRAPRLRGGRADPARDLGPSPGAAVPAGLSDLRGRREHGDHLLEQPRRDDLRLRAGRAHRPLPGGAGHRPARGLRARQTDRHLGPQKSRLALAAALGGRVRFVLLRCRQAAVLGGGLRRRAGTRIGSGRHARLFHAVHPGGEGKPSTSGSTRSSGRPPPSSGRWSSARCRRRSGASARRSSRSPSSSSWGSRC